MAWAANRAVLARPTTIGLSRAPLLLHVVAIRWLTINGGRILPLRGKHLRPNADDAALPTIPRTRPMNNDCIGNTASIRVR